ncbi:MAG: hypothetical protein U1E63_04195 [Burkholderiales bacterium]
MASETIRDYIARLPDTTGGTLRRADTTRAAGADLPLGFALGRPGP